MNRLRRRCLPVVESNRGSGTAAHTVGMAVAREPPFGDAVAADPPPDSVTRVPAPETYAEILDRLGFDELYVRLQV